MDLSSLPLLILEEILQNLESKTLLAISMTCKKLHEEANRLLYDDPSKTSLCLDYESRKRRGSKRFRSSDTSRLEALERILIAAPQLGKIIRIHSSFDIDLLRRLWSERPLILDQLSLRFQWFATSTPLERSECIESMHYKTRVKRIFVETAKKGYDGVLENLSLFQGLESLHLEVASMASPQLHPDYVASRLHCPNLRYLTLQFCDIVVLPDHLPNLSVLVLDRVSETLQSLNEHEAGYYTRQEKWRRLNVLREKQIKLLYRHPLGPYSSEVPLLHFVFDYASRNYQTPAPMVEWLLDSHLSGKTDVETTTRLSLRRFSKTIRDGTLQILNRDDSSSCLGGHLAIDLSLCWLDRPSLAHMIPNAVRHLQLVISVQERIDPLVVRNMVEVLTMLRTFNIRVFGDLCPINWYRDCFATSFPGGLPSSETREERRREVRGVFVKVERGGAIKSVIATWEPWSDVKLLEIDLPELEEEIRGWMSLNSELKEVEIQFHHVT